MQLCNNGSLCQVFVGTFFVFRNSVGKLCVSWVLSLVECVAVWALKLPVPHTDVLKTHSSQSFSTELLEYKGTGSEHLPQTNPSKLNFSLYLRICNAYLLSHKKQFVRSFLSYFASISRNSFVAFASFLIFFMMEPLNNIRNIIFLNWLTLIIQ